MAQGNRRMLYADLFKTSNKTREPESPSSSWTSAAAVSDYSSSWSSTASDLCSDDGDFIDQLTREMAECMLQEDHQDPIPDSGSDEFEGWENRPSYPEHAASLQMKNQPPTMEPSSNHFGGSSNSWIQVQTGEGMRAVFLQGPAKASSGTGVFLPRAKTTPVELKKKKTGCSTVLIPNRVLEILELHHNKRFSSDSSSGFRSQDAWEQKRNHDDQTLPRLPQEWTY